MHKNTRQSMFDGQPSFVFFSGHWSTLGLKELANIVLWRIWGANAISSFTSWCVSQSDFTMINHWPTSQYKWMWGLSLYSYKLRSSQSTTDADAEMMPRWWRMFLKRVSGPALSPGIWWLTIWGLRHLFCSGVQLCIFWYWSSTK